MKVSFTIGIFFALAGSAFSFGSDIVVWEGRHNSIDPLLVLRGLAIDHCASALHGQLSAGWKLFPFALEKTSRKPLVGKATAASVYLSRYDLRQRQVLVVQEAHLFSLIPLLGTLGATRMYTGGREGIYQNAAVLRENPLLAIPPYCLDLALFVDSVPPVELPGIMSALIPLMKRGGRIEFQVSRENREFGFWTGYAAEKFKATVDHAVECPHSWFIPELCLPIKSVFRVR